MIPYGSHQRHCIGSAPVDGEVSRCTTGRMHRDDPMNGARDSLEHAVTGNGAGRAVTNGLPTRGFRMGVRSSWKISGSKKISTAR